MTECLENSYCTVFFYNFFNTLSLITKLFDRGLYGVGTARKNRVEMPKMTTDRKMRTGDLDYMYSDKVACKWFDRRSVLMVVSNIEGMSKTSTTLRRQKGSASICCTPTILHCLISKQLLRPT